MVDITASTTRETADVAAGRPPFSDYDKMNMEEITEQLDRLSEAELRRTRNYEQGNKNLQTLSRRWTAGSRPPPRDTASRGHGRVPTARKGTKHGRQSRVDDQQQQRINRAAQEFTEVLVAAYRTASDNTAAAQQLGAQQIEYFFDAVMGNLRAQAGGTSQMARQLASQQRLAQEATQDIARASTDNYMDLLDSVFSFYQGGASRTQRRADEARGHIEEAETRAEQAETRAEQAETRAEQAERARSEAESQAEEAKKSTSVAKRRATEAEKRASEAESRAEEAEKRAEQAQEQSQETNRRLQEAESRAEEAQGESQETRRSLQEAQRRAEEAESRTEEAERGRSEAEGREGDEEADAEADAASQPRSPAGDRRSEGGTPELGTGAPGEEGRVELTSEDDEDAESGNPSPS